MGEFYNAFTAGFLKANDPKTIRITKRCLQIVVLNIYSSV